MQKLFGRLAGALLALMLTSGLAAAQSKVTIAVGGGSCLCYLPTVLAKAARRIRKGRARRRTGRPQGRLGCAQGGARRQRRRGFRLFRPLRQPRRQEAGTAVLCGLRPLSRARAGGVALKHTAEIKSIKDLAGKKVGVSAPGSSTDFFLKYLLKKNGLDPTSAAVIGVGLGATAVAAMQQGQIEAAVMLDPSVTVLQGELSRTCKILADTRTQKDTLDVFGGEYPGGALYTTRRLDQVAREGSAGADQRDRQHAGLDPFAFAGRDHGEDAGRRSSARTRSSISRR